MDSYFWLATFAFHSEREENPKTAWLNYWYLLLERILNMFFITSCGVEFFRTKEVTPFFDAVLSPATSTRRLCKIINSRIIRFRISL